MRIATTGRGTGHAPIPGAGYGAAALTGGTPAGPGRRATGDHTAGAPHGPAAHGRPSGEEE
jgi:hypothetical protein|nr:MAG: hypothetical protein DIU60_15265 [Actinomycetota bacterium]